MKLLLVSLMLILFSVACSRTRPISARTPSTPVVNETTEVDPGNLNDTDEEEVVTNEPTPAVVYVQVPMATPTPTPTPTPVPYDYAYSAPAPAPTPVPAVTIPTHPIYRSMNTAGGRYWTRAWSNIVNACSNYQHTSEGIAFSLATSPVGPCNLAVYACLFRPYAMYFLTYDSGCGLADSTMAEFMGYACNPNSGAPTRPLYIQRHSNGFLFYTASDSEANAVAAGGFSTIGAFYVPQ